MPPQSAVASVKRKRPSDGERPDKRQRSSSSEEDDAGSRILLLEKGILESKKNYNDITVLLDLMNEHRSGNPDSMLAAVALCRVFIRMLAQDAFSAKKNASEKDLVVSGWLKNQFALFKASLLTFLQSDELSITSLTLCMRVLKAEGERKHENEDYSFPSALLQDIVKEILQSDDEDLCGSFLEEYVEQFDDIRFHTFKSVKFVLDSLPKESQKIAFDRAFALLSALDGVPESAEELEDFMLPAPKKKNHPLRSVIQHKKQGQEAWLALLGIAEGEDQRKKILNIVSTVVAPWFVKLELLADFLTHSYDTGGSTSLLALSGVFYLIQERNLDYPLFYHKLYSLLDRDILHSKYRSRFFRLLDTFLASTHLPAALVASFVKRLSRLALNAPPAAIVFVVPWIYNQLRRHPSCTFMVHRETKDLKAKKEIKEKGIEDPFDPDETDPMETQAIDSCLWELVQLQSHYHPNVATIAKIISEQFTKQSYNMEDFLDHSYASLFEAEMNKEVKKAPVVEFHIPKRVFLPQDSDNGVSDSLLVKLWGF